MHNKPSPPGTNAATYRGSAFAERTFRSFCVPRWVHRVFRQGRCWETCSYASVQSTETEHTFLPETMYGTLSLAKPDVLWSASACADLHLPAIWRSVRVELLTLDRWSVTIVFDVTAHHGLDSFQPCSSQGLFHFPPFFRLQWLCSSKYEVLYQHFRDRGDLSVCVNS